MKLNSFASSKRPLPRHIAGRDFAIDLGAKMIAAMASGQQQKIEILPAPVFGTVAVPPAGAESSLHIFSLLSFGEIHCKRFPIESGPPQAIAVR